VISGFCIHLAVAKTLGQGKTIDANWPRFWRKRFFRLYPPYLVAIIYSAAIYYYIAADPLREKYNLAPIVNLAWDTITHLLLIHNLFLPYCGGLGNSPFWTLGLEEQLYGLYAGCLWIRLRRSPLRIVATVLIVSLVWTYVFKVVTAIWWSCGTPPEHQSIGCGPFQFGVWQRWPFHYWFAWVLGAAAAEGYTRASKLPLWCYRNHSLLLFLACCILTNDAVWRGPLAWGWFGAAGPFLRQGSRLADGLSEPFFALSMFVLLNRWVELERRQAFAGWWVAPIAGIGLMSYSLYLTHEPLLNLSRSNLQLGSSPEEILIGYAIYPPICLAFAALFFFAVERHFLNRPSPAFKSQVGAA
jgi:peptidoglycan/LPS O-acetylase OafA/YrhL